MLTRRVLLGAGFAAALSGGESAFADASAASRAKLRNTIRLWGSPADRTLISLLQDGFAVHNPQIRFRNALHGPESTLAGVYTGVADLAFMARELREPMERMAFEWATLSKPFVIDIANAGVIANRSATQLAVFVRKDNPVRQMSLAELDAVLGTERRRGGQPVTNWSDLGATGALRKRPVRVYGPPVDSIPALYIRKTVMEDSRKWITDYRDSGRGADILAALARDPAGIGYAPVRCRVASVRALALSAGNNGPYYKLDARTVINETYPLIRKVSVILRRAEGKTIAPPLRAFLSFILSPEGQAIVTQEGSYLPLNEHAAARQRERLV